MCCRSDNVEWFVGANRAHARGTNLFLGEQYQPHISNTKKTIVRKKSILLVLYRSKD
jgi:hypothetical protein